MIQVESEWPQFPVLPSYGSGRNASDGRFSSLVFGTNLTDVIITGNYLDKLIAMPLLKFFKLRLKFDLLNFVHKVTMGQLMDKDLFGGTSSTRVK